SRIGVVDECYAVADENVVFHRDPLADERVAGNFAIFPYPRVLLYFHKSANLRAVTYFTAVKIDKFRELDAFSKLHVGSNRKVVVHSCTILPFWVSDLSAASSM